MSLPLINAAPSTAPRGKFISLEGGEGAGKSTLLAGLREYVEQHGIKLVQTREPGGTSLRSEEHTSELQSRP